MWENINGQTEAVSYLKGLVQNNALSHAYLFIGPSGVGKFTTAQVLAAVLNCENLGENGCGRCSSCLKIFRQVHPDVFYIEPEGNFITIDQIRELKNRALLKPHEGNVKIFILDEVERLNSPAANALLKILEEPPPYLLFVLIAENLEALLPTIVSRCQLIRFRAIRQDYLESLLVANYGRTDEEAKLVTRLTGGVYSETVKWTHFPEKFLKRERVLKILQDLPHFDLFRLLTEAENLISEVKESIDKIRSRQKEDLAKEEKETSFLAFKKDLQEKHRREIYREELKSFQEIFSIVRSWHRDLLVLNQTGESSLLINLDKGPKLAEVSQRSSLDGLNKAIKIVENSEGLLKLNINKPLIMERLFLKLKENC